MTRERKSTFNGGQTLENAFLVALTNQFVSLFFFGGKVGNTIEKKIEKVGKQEYISSKFKELIANDDVRS